MIRSADLSVVQQYALRTMRIHRLYGLAEGVDVEVHKCYVGLPVMTVRALLRARLVWMQQQRVRLTKRGRRWADRLLKREVA